jgi:hypothetical protein
VQPTPTRSHSTCPDCRQGPTCWRTRPARPGPARFRLVGAAQPALLSPTRPASPAALPTLPRFGLPRFLPGLPLTIRPVLLGIARPCPGPAPSDPACLARLAWLSPARLVQPANLPCPAQPRPACPARRARPYPARPDPACRSCTARLSCLGPGLLGAAQPCADLAARRSLPDPACSAQFGLSCLPGPARSGLLGVAQPVAIWRHPARPVRLGPACPTRPGLPVRPCLLGAAQSCPDLAPPAAACPAPLALPRSACPACPACPACLATAQRNPDPAPPAAACPAASLAQPRLSGLPCPATVPIRPAPRRPARPNPPQPPFRPPRQQPPHPNE